MKTLPLILLLAMFFLFLIAQKFDPIVATASPSQEKLMHFYFHWLEKPVYVGGRDQHYIMNTTQFFQAYNNSIYKAVGSPKLVVAFYLYPHLAGSVTFNGTWRVFVWVNGSALKPCEWDIQFFEIDSGGTTIWDSDLIDPIVTGGPAGYPGYLSPQILCYNLSTPNPITHTFTQDTTIVVEITINPGADIACELWYDSPTFPSKAIFPSMDYARPSSVRTYDVNGTERNVFEMYWNESQRKVVVRANVTDPFGGYDIYMVNVTIFDPASNPVLDNVNMIRTSDALWVFSYSHIYEANWTYPETAMSGNYTVKVSVVDNNGYYHYLTYSIYDPYIEYGYHSFSIGISYQINFFTVDTISRPLVGATVSVLHFNVLMVQGITDNNGNFSVMLATGFYNITVYWQNTLVNTTINYEVAAPANVSLLCLVYDVEVEVVDSLNAPLENAEVFITFPNGTVTILPLYTNINGRIPLLLTPYGTYDFTVYWQGTMVNKTQTTLNFNGIFTISCRVYTVVLSLVDSLEKPLANALIVFNAPNGTSNLAIFTDLYGNVSLIRVSNGTYEFTIIWQLTPILMVSEYIDANTPIIIQCPVYYLTVRAVDSMGEALSGAEVVTQFPTGIKTVYITNSTGHVTLSQIIGGYYNFTVIWFGFPVNSTDPLLVDTNLPVYTVECSVYYLTVEVVDSLGEALSNAQVVVQSPAGLKSVYIANGTGHLELSQIAGGNYSFTVFWFGVSVNVTSLFIDANLPVFTITTRVYYPIFYVVDSKGEPLANASVTLTGALTRTGFTDQSGIITFDQIPTGNFELIVMWHYVRVSSTDPILIDRSASAYTIATYVYYLTFKVVDSTGMALSNARVIAQFPTGIKAIYITNSTGHVELSQIAVGNYNFVVSWFGVSVNSTDLFINANIPTYTIITQVYHPTFYVVDGDGTPLIGATVSLSGVTTTIGSTDQSGKITFSQIPIGDFDVIVLWYDIRVSPSEPILVDRNQPAYTISTSVYSLMVQVVNSHGNPMTGVSVTLTGPHLTQTGVTDKNGNVEFRQLPTNDYNINASYVGQYAFALWLKTGSESVTLNETQTVTIQLAYPPTTVEVLSSTFPWILVGVLIAVIASFLIPIVLKKWKAFRTKTPKTPK